MPDCEYYEELLSARLDGPLSPEEQAALNTHLVSCPHCRNYAQQLQALPLSLLTAAAEPPDHLVGQIMAEVKAASPAAKPKKLSRRWAGLACAAVLALILLAAPPSPFSGGSPEAGESASIPETSEPAEGFNGGSTADEELPTEGAAEEFSQEASPETESAESAPPPQGQLTQDTAAFSQDSALHTLEIHLKNQGRNGLILTPMGLSEDGKSWLFTAEIATGSPAALFSVSQITGEIREMPIAEEITP